MKICDDDVIKNNGWTLMLLMAAAVELVERWAYYAGLEALFYRFKPVQMPGFRSCSISAVKAKLA